MGVAFSLEQSLRHGLDFFHLCYATSNLLPRFPSLMYPLQLVADADAQLQGVTDALVMGGAVRLDEGAGIAAWQALWGAATTPETVGRDVPQSAQRFRFLWALGETRGLGVGWGWGSSCGSRVSRRFEVEAPENRRSRVCHQCRSACSCAGTYWSGLGVLQDEGQANERNVSHSGEQREDEDSNAHVDCPYPP